VKRILLDENLPRGLANALRQTGLVCHHVEDLGLLATDDRQILQWAEENNAVVMTKDSDFVNLHTMLGIGRVCLAKIGNLPRAQTIETLVVYSGVLAEFLGSGDTILVLAPASPDSS